MLCEKCKTNPATTHIQKWVNGVQEEWVLCSQCAKEMGYTKLSFFTGGLLGSLFSGELTDKTALGGVQCPFCGIQFEEIAKQGQVGCEDCYKFFGSRLTPTIEKLHGKAGHVGKVPHNRAKAAGVEKPQPPSEDSLDWLKEQLRIAVENQEFEQAAILRDKIKEREGSENG